MANTTYKTLLSFGLLLLCSGGITLGQTREQSKASLRGLRGVFVLVADLELEIKQEGLSVTQLQTDVELRIRKAGIQVLTKEQWHETAGEPYLYVNVHARVLDQGQFPYNVMVQLKQDVILVRNPSMQTPAVSWQMGGLGVAGDMKTIREFLGDAVWSEPQK